MKKIVLILVLLVILLNLLNNSNVIKNNNYYVLLFVESIFAMSLCYIFFRSKPWEKSLNNLKAFVVTILVILFIFFPLNNFLLIIVSDSTEQIFLKGKIVSVMSPYGRTRSYYVTFNFKDGTEHSWSMPQYSYHVYNDKLIADHKILQNYLKYDEIYVIGHKGFLGINLIGFLEE